MRGFSRRRRLCCAIVAAAALMTGIPAEAHNGVHYTVVATNGERRGVMRRLEVTNPSVKWDGAGYFTAAQWHITSNGYGEVGWGEWGDVSTRQYVYYNAPGDTRVRSFIVNPGDVISLRVFAPNDVDRCSTQLGWCILRYEVYQGGQWALLGYKDIASTTGLGTEHLTYNYKSPADNNLNHGELAQAPAGENVNTYNAMLARWVPGSGFALPSVAWDTWSSSVGTSTSNYDPYYNGYHTQYTDFYGYCFGSCG